MVSDVSSDLEYQLNTDASSTPTLEWLDDFSGGGDLDIFEAKHLIQLANICMVYLEEGQASFREKVQDRKKDAETQLDRLRHKKLQGDEREARRRLKKIINISEGKKGWMSISTEEAGMLLTLAENPKQPEADNVHRATLAMLAEIEVLIKSKGEFERRVNIWMGTIHNRLRSFSYFSQMQNRNYLPSGKSEAWERTCNVTSLGMTLDALTISPHQFNKDYRLDIIKVYCALQNKDKVDMVLWEQEVSQLRMPNFLQLVAIHWFWEQLIDGNKCKKLAQNRGEYKLNARCPALKSCGKFHTFLEKKQITMASICAKNAITSSVGIFEILASRFGLQQYRVTTETFDSLPSVGREITRHLNKQQTLLRLILASSLSTLWNSDEDSTGIARLLWSIGFRPEISKKELGDRLTLTYGPLNTSLENEIKKVKAFSGSTEDNFTNKDMRDLVGCMIRIIVSKLTIKDDQKETDDERNKIIASYGIDEVLTKAKELGFNRDIKSILSSKSKNDRKLINRLKVYKEFTIWLNTDLLWIEIVENFHCNIEVERDVTVVKEWLDDSNTPKTLEKHITAIVVEWNKTQKLLDKFRKSTGLELRKAVMEKVEPLLKDGAAIVVNQKGHYTFLVEVNENGIIVNDPAWLPKLGSKGRNTKHSWGEASRLGFFRAYHVFFHPDLPKGHPRYRAPNK